MTPDQARQLEELYGWMQQKKQQQISLPLDEASRQALDAVQSVTNGSSALTQVYSGSDPQGGIVNITASKAYAGTVVLLINGVRRELPYL